MAGKWLKSCKFAAQEAQQTPMMRCARQSIILKASAIADYLALRATAKPSPRASLAAV